MEYLRTEIVRPERRSSNDPHYVGHIVIRFSDKEALQFFDFGHHNRLRQLMSDMASSLSAAGSRVTDVSGFQDVALEVAVRGELDTSNADAVERWGLSMFQEIRATLERM